MQMGGGSVATGRVPSDAQQDTVPAGTAGASSSRAEPGRSRPDGPAVRAGRTSTCSDAVVFSQGSGPQPYLSLYFANTVFYSGFVWVCAEMIHFS